MKTYHAIVVGSGQGGVPLATNMAGLGWRVALIEKGQLGGSVHQLRLHAHQDDGLQRSNRPGRRRAPEFGIHTGKVR